VKKRRRRKRSSNYYASPSLSPDSYEILPPVIASYVSVGAELCETNSVARSETSDASVFGAIDSHFPLLVSENRFSGLAACPDKQAKYERSGALSKQTVATVGGDNFELKSDTNQTETENDDASKFERDRSEQERRGKCNELLQFLTTFKSCTVRQSLRNIIKKNSDSCERLNLLDELFDDITHGFG